MNKQSINLEKLFNLTPEADTRLTDPDIGPYLKLIVRLLYRSVLDYHGLTFDAAKTKYATRRAWGRCPQSEAKEWFESLEEAPFTFRWCVDHLGIDPTYFLKMLKSLKIDSNLRLPYRK